MKERYNKNGYYYEESLFIKVAFLNETECIYLTIVTFCTKQISSEQ